MATVTKKGYFSLGLFLALGLIVSTMILTDTYEDTRTTNTITVKGYAEKAIVSDRVNWQGTVTVYSNDLAAATAQLAQNMGRVRDFLTSKGISAKEITLRPVETRYEYAINSQGYSTGERTGSVASQMFEVESADVEKVQMLSVEISKLIQEGIEINSLSPAFSFTGLDAMKMELLAEATKNAYQRAEVIAENGESEVGSLKYASQGVFQITSESSSEVSDYGIVDQTSIRKLAKAVVTAEFAIE